MNAYLWNKGIYNLRSERFGELKEKDDGELPPGKRCDFHWLRKQQGGLLVNLAGHYGSGMKARCDI